MPRMNFMFPDKFADELRLRWHQSGVPMTREIMIALCERWGWSPAEAMKDGRTINPSDFASSEKVRIAALVKAGLGGQELADQRARSQELAEEIAAAAAKMKNRQALENERNATRAIAMQYGAQAAFPNGEAAWFKKIVPLLDLDDIPEWFPSVIAEQLRAGVTIDEMEAAEKARAGGPVDDPAAVLAAYNKERREMGIAEVRSLPPGLTRLSQIPAVVAKINVEDEDHWSPPDWGPVSVANNEGDTAPFITRDDMLDF